MPPESAITEVVSWNTGERYRWRLRNWTPDASLGDIARRVGRWLPEVCCLQEIRSQAQLDVLCARLGPPWHGRLTDMPKSDRQVALLTRLPASGTTFTEVATSVGRNALRLTVPASTGGQVHVVGCHGNAFSSSARRTYFHELIDDCEALPASDTVLLVGDFNIDPWLAWLTADRHTLRRLRRGWHRLLRGRRTTCMGLFHLDHAYVRAAGAVPATAAVITGTRGYRRDHSPLWVRLAARLRRSEAPDTR